MNYDVDFKAHGLANICIAKGGSTEDRLQQVYEIEASWYRGRHPLTFNEHQSLIQEHKNMLQNYRKETELSFKDLASGYQEIDMENILSGKNLKLLSTFSTQVFQKSKECSDGYVKVLRSIIESSIHILKRIDKHPPCKFAVISLGSIAKGVATPYSDVGYAIIVESDTDIDYFMMLAVDSYFRIGNFAETPIKSLGITELNHTGRPLLVNTPTVGVRLAISEGAYNIPTGPEDGHRLILTVDSFMDLYRTSACSPPTDVPWDVSHLLSSSVLIYSNEGEKPELHKKFVDAVLHEEKTHFRFDQFVAQKRLRTFLGDIERCNVLPDFKGFDPSNSLHLDINFHIYRYPTLLAHNFKICLALESQHPWEIFTELHQKGMLSEKIYYYLQIALALSVFIRTSAHMSLRIQSEKISVQPEVGKFGEKHYHIPLQFYMCLGIIIVPIQRSITQNVHNQLDTLDSKTNVMILGKEIAEKIQCDELDYMLKVELYYLAGRYRTSLKELSSGIGKDVTTMRSHQFIQRIKRKYRSSEEFITEKKCLQICSYLLYRCGYYMAAIDYLSALPSYTPTRIEIVHWKMATADCLLEVQNRKSAIPLLQQVLRVLSEQLGLSKQLNFIEQIRRRVGSELSPNHQSLFNMVAEACKLLGNAFIESQRFDEGVDYLKISVHVYKSLSKPLSLSLALQFLATALQKLSRYKEAAGCFQEALGLLQEITNKDDYCSHSLAKCFLKVGDLYHAVNLFNSSLKSYQESCNPWSSQTSSDYATLRGSIANFNKGKILENMGHIAEAMKLYTESLKHIAKVSLQPSLTSIDNLSYCSKKLGLVARAAGKSGMTLKYASSQQTMMRSAQFTLHNFPDRRASYVNIGNIYFAVGEYDLALEYYLGSLKMQTSLPGSNADKSEIADIYNSIAIVLSNQRQYSKALAMQIKSLELYEALHGKDTFSLRYTGIYDNIGNTYTITENFREALEYYSKSLSYKQHIYEGFPSHTSIADSYRNIGICHVLTNLYNGALEYFTIALDIYCSAYKFTVDKTTVSEISTKSLHQPAVNQAMPDHSDIANLLDDIGTTYCCMSN